MHNLRSILFQFYPSTTSKYYSQSEIGVLSYTQRGTLFLYILFYLLPQSHKILVYFNSTTPLILNFVKRLNNVQIIPFVTDHRALSKFYLIPHYQTKYNFILDDDIIFPPEFISHSCSLLEKNPKEVHSYNGFCNDNKYSFQKVFQEPNEKNLHLGTGTLFFSKSVFSFEQLYKTMLEYIIYTSIQHFCR